MSIVYETSVILFTLTQISCYTLMAPKLYGKSLPTTARGWSSVVPYPFRAYRPSIPVQYYGRYVADPYYNPTLQNSDYYFTQDNYPYTSSFDDADYYSNILYYIPGSRRTPYYDQSVADPIDEIQDDYDEVPSSHEYLPKSQREWWLEKNVPPNEDTDFARFNFAVDDDAPPFFNLNERTSPLPPSKIRQNKYNPANELNSRKILSKSRYAGIDGFGRKKERAVFGNYRFNSRRDDDRTSVYGVPIREDTDDETVQELKSLMEDRNKEETPQPPPPSSSSSFTNRYRDYDGNSADLSNWISGSAKRNVRFENGGSGSGSSERSDTKLMPVVKPTKWTGGTPFKVYDESGRENIPKNSDEAYAQKQPSVFDTIKKLLALEDMANQHVKFKGHKRCYGNVNCEWKNTKISKKSRGNNIIPEITITSAMKSFPENSDEQTTTTKPIKISTNKNQKRSTVDKINSKKIITDEELSLVRELSALRHIKS